jgi:hypothetical protein
MNVRIGANDVFKHVSVLIPSGLIATIPLQVDGWNLSVDVVVKDDGGPATADISVIKSNHARLELKNWSTPLGTSMDEPAEIAKTHLGVQVLFLVASWRVGTLNRVEIQFMRRA